MLSVIWPEVKTLTRPGWWTLAEFHGKTRIIWLGKRWAFERNADDSDGFMVIDSSLTATVFIIERKPTLQLHSDLLRQGFLLSEEPLWAEVKVVYYQSKTNSSANSTGRGGLERCRIKKNILRPAEDNLMKKVDDLNSEQYDNIAGTKNSGNGNSLAKHGRSGNLAQSGVNRPVVALTR